MCDQRMQSSSPPYPAPEEMTLIPRSHWANECNWYVPAPFTSMMTNNYISLICRSVDYQNDSIMISFNGKPAVPIKASNLLAKKLWSSIPAGDDLIGLTMTCEQGSYYAYNLATDGSLKEHVPFMIYNYGMWGWDAKGSLGDDDGDDYYWEYAHPTAAVYRDLIADHSTLSVTTQDACGAVQVCITDTGALKHGIRYIELMNYYSHRFVNAQPPTVNASISDGTNDNPSEIILPNAPNSFCFTVNPVNPLSEMKAHLAIYDNMGMPVFVDVQTSALALQMSTNSPLTSVVGGDTLVFATTSVGSSSCPLLSVKNIDVVAHRIDSARIINLPKVFSMDPGSVIPAKLGKNETVSISICFVPADTGIFLSTLILKDSCGRSIPCYLTGRGISGIVSVTDTIFPTTKPNASICGSVTIKNIGTAAFTLTGLQLSDGTNFRIDSNTSNIHLPLSLAPGAQITLDVCFEPKSEGNLSATITCLTDIPSNVASYGKNISHLSGVSSTNGVRSASGDISGLHGYINGNQLIIEPVNEIPVHSRFELYDLLGRRIVEWDNISTGSLPMPQVAAGVYIVRIISSGTISSFEVLKN
jgi:hypothetical protein